MATPNIAPTEAPKPNSIWPRVCRLSVYFTIIGATLCYFRYRLASQMMDLGNQINQLESLPAVSESYLSTFYLMCGFTLLSCLVLILSLVMMWKARKNN